MDTRGSHQGHEKAFTGNNKKYIILILRAGDLLFHALKDTLTIIRD